MTEDRKITVLIDKDQPEGLVDFFKLNDLHMKGEIMADANGRIIPLVDDDQGEGIKDFFQDLYEIEANISNTVLSNLVSEQAGMKTEAEARQFLKSKCEFNQS